MNATTTARPATPASVARQNLAVSDYGDAIRYGGTSDQLVAAGLVEADQSFVAPPGKHGVRFVNKAGQRVVISKWKTPGMFCLCIYRTRAEIEARAREKATEQRLAEIDEQLRLHEMPQAAYRQEVRNILSGCMILLWGRMFTRGEGAPQTPPTSERCDSARRPRMRCASIGLDCVTPSKTRRFSAMNPAPRRCAASALR